METDDFKNQLNTIDPTGKGQLNLSYTDADGNVHTVTLRYDGATVSAPQLGSSDPSKDTETRKDVTDNVITGTAYVNGSNTWTESGSLNGTYVKPGSGELPSLDGWTVDTNDPEKGTTIYKKEDTVTSPDGTITKITRTCTITESSASLSDTEKEEIAWAELLNQHPEYKNKDELKAAGYNINISSMDFSGIKRVEWTIDELSESTKTDAKDLNDKLVIPGGKNWSIDEKAGTITVDGKTYDKVTKTNDGYTCTVEDKNGVKTTYTFTKQAGAPLTPEEIQTALAGQYSVSADSIRLNADGKTATFTKGNETITVDYSTLSETLTVRKDVHTSSSVTDIIKDDKDLEKAYDELWKQIQEIQSKLQPGEELWIGDLQIKDIDSQKEEIIKHFTTAVSHENMSQQALIAALNAQADEAKTTKVTVNEGTKYQEELKNYYSGDENLKHKPKDPPKHWNGQPKELEKGDGITHLDLASGAKMDKLPDANGNVTQTDCVLLAKGQKLEWNYDAKNLLADQSTLKNSDKNHTVGLQDYISKDTEDGSGYHYEYDRLDGKNNNPEKSAFYKLTGTVAYDALKNEDGSITTYSGWNAERDAVNDYLKAVGRKGESYDTLSRKQRQEILGTYVVPITNDSSFGSYTTYQVYTKTAEMTSYGYMTRDANTCINSTYKRQDGTWGYVGGYDLMISDLVQVSEGKVVGQTQSDIKTLWAPLAVRSTQNLENKSLQLNAKHTSTPKTETENLGSGYEEKGTFTYDVSYEHTDKYANHCSQGVKGTGTGKYKTFTQLLKEKFSGKGETSYDTGNISYTYRTTENVDTTALSKETKNTTTAKATYNFTTVARKNFTVTTPADPEEPTPPQEEEVETPDEVVTPETPELPPVQDATPDQVIAPANPELPPVQDATALPQTGVNWMAALGMAFSGMLLTIAGAFASLKYKEKH